MQIVEYTLTRAMIYTNVCVIYSAEIEHVFPYFKTEPLSFWPWIWILFFSKFLEAKHGPHMANYTLVDCFPCSIFILVFYDVITVWL